MSDVRTPANCGKKVLVLTEKAKVFQKNKYIVRYTLSCKGLVQSSTTQNLKHAKLRTRHKSHVYSAKSHTNLYILHEVSEVWENMDSNSIFALNNMTW